MFQCALWLNRSRRSTSALVSVSSRRTSCSRRPFIGSFSSSSRSSRVTSQSLYRSSAFHSHSILSNNDKSRNLASFSSSSSAASAASSTPHPHALRLLLEDYQTLQCPYTPEEEPRDLWNARRKKLRKKLGLYRLLRDEELRELVAGLRDPVEEGLESALERAAAVGGGNEDQEAAAASRVGEKEFVLFPGAGSWNITPIKGGRQSNLDANFQSARTSHEVTSSTHSSESLSSSPSSTTTTPSAPPPAPAPAQTKSRRPTSDLEAEGYALQKVFEMKDWMAGIEFLNRASEIIEDQDHHPSVHMKLNPSTMLLELSIQTYTHAPRRPAPLSGITSSSSTTTASSSSSSSTPTTSSEEDGEDLVRRLDSARQDKPSPRSVRVDKEMPAPAPGITKKDVLLAWELDRLEEELREVE